MSKNRDFLFISYCTSYLSEITRDCSIDCSHISPQFLSGMLNLCCQNSSFPQRLQNWTILQRLTLLILFPLQWMNMLTEYPSRWTCRPNPPNVLNPLRSPKIPPCPHTTSQRQNSPNYHFKFGLLSTDYSSDPHYKNHQNVEGTSIRFRKKMRPGKFW